MRELSTKTHFTLRRLSPKHRNIAALLAQGLGRSDISKLVRVSPEYVTMLAKQPLFIEYIKGLTQFVDARLQAMFDKSVDVVADLMRSGTEDTKLRAAQTVMKAVGKDGTKEKTTSATVFVVQLPSKAASTSEWENQHKRIPVTVENGDG